MENNTTTRNGDSKNRLKQETDKCTVIVTNQAEIAQLWTNVEGPVVDLTEMQTKKAPKIKDGIRPEEQGDTLDATHASRLGNEKIITIIDSTKQRTEKAKEVPENEAQKAAREKLELSRRAQEKYNEENIDEDR